MSGDETIALLVFCAIGVVTWYRYFKPAAAVRRPGGTWGLGWWLFGVAAVCATTFFVVLATWASADVRDSGLYLFFYMLFGAAWVGLGTTLLPRFGLSVRDDVIERRNWAAAFAIGGAMLGLTFAFAGANVGNGPSWSVVLFSGALSTGGLLAVWGIVNAITPAHEHVTVDRDLASGLRTGALLLACGAILGRGAAGDWVDVWKTTVDFVRVGWPALVIAVAGGVIERLAALDGRVPRRSAFVYGVLPGAAYVIAAGKVLQLAGPW
jgi:uncharacterized membrane protein YjfL (UPF0719 family)